MVRLLDFAPAAWHAYQALPAGELGSSVKAVLQELADDPEPVRAISHRHRVIEERLPEPTPVWALPVGAVGRGRWLLVWREVANVIEIGYIGPAERPAAGTAGS